MTPLSNVHHNAVIYGGGDNGMHSCVALSALSPKNRSNNVSPRRSLCSYSKCSAALTISCACRREVTWRLGDQTGVAIRAESEMSIRCDRYSQSKSMNRLLRSISSPFLRVPRVCSKGGVKMRIKWKSMCISKNRTDVMWSHAATIRARNPRDGPIATGNRTVQYKKL